MKKILIGTSALLTALAITPMFAAFEAHVVNVTAKIEQALNVPLESLDFGIVFPQEKHDKQVVVSLSQSFQDAERMDDVEYFIRQKPKCGLPIGDTDPVEYDAFGQVTEDEQGNFICKDEGYVMLPLLCPYLSKAELTDDGIEGENDGEALLSFHGPIALADWTLAVAEQYDVPGRLVKSGQDLSDTWNIDLKVPCFGGHCAQDWANFVRDINPEANPDDYIQPIEDEHELYGCDLWLEVTEYSAPPAPPENGTVTIKKVVLNNNGGNNNAGDWSLDVGGEPVGNGVAEEFAPSGYVIGESGPLGYAPTFSGDCDENGNLTVEAGEHYICIVTNDDVAPTITLVKEVINDDEGVLGPDGFSLRLNGSVVDQSVPQVVGANVAHAITEDPVLGYDFDSITGDAKCPAVLGGTATLDEGEAITCTIHNDDVPLEIVVEPETLLDDGFGTGETSAAIAGWEKHEDGTVALAPSGGGDDSVSPAGGRFAHIAEDTDDGVDGWICRSVDATGYDSLILSYLWRGDSDGEGGEAGLVQYRTDGTCALADGWSELASHALSPIAAWAANGIGLPGALENTSFLLRFYNSSNANDESFRVDDVYVTGIPI